MPDAPAAEIVVDARLAAAMVDRARIALPHLRAAEIRHAADGWDCSVWRIGADAALRIPRRAAAAPLIAHEASALPRIAPAVEATGIRLPTPLHVGGPVAGYPWQWSIVPWIDGLSGLGVPRERRSGWAEALARALGALHVPAGAEHPVNPVRGVPLGRRDPAVRARLDLARTAGLMTDAECRRGGDLWQRGLDTAPWRDAPVWVHGDLHPGNLIADRAGLRGIIDFGDVTGGDPAYDLSVGWLAFDAVGRERFVSATDGRYDGATWTRARAWAAAMAVTLITHSDDRPDYGALGRESLREVTSADD